MTKDRYLQTGHDSRKTTLTESVEARTICRVRNDSDCASDDCIVCFAFGQGYGFAEMIKARLCKSNLSATDILSLGAYVGSLDDEGVLRHMTL